MASVNTNAAAITALRTLQQTNASLDKTQNKISTGYKIGEAKDNAAYWAISTTLKSDNKSLATVKDALGLGASTVDVAYQGLNKAKDVLDEIKSKLTAATQDGVNRDTIQDEVKQLQEQLKSIAASSVFSGENWLATDTSSASYNANKQVVSSFSRDASGSVSIGTIGVNISKIALFDGSTTTAKSGIIDSALNLKGKDGRDLAIGGTDVGTGNTATAGLTGAVGTTTGSATAAGGNNTSVVAAGAAANALSGPTAVAPYSVATAAKEALTGTFTPVNLDDNDGITLVFRQDGDSTDRTVTITKASTASGAGVIASVDDLVAAANTALTAATQTGVKAIKDPTTGAFALQRWDSASSAPLTGSTRSVNIVSWTGVDPTLASPVSITGGSVSNTGGSAGTQAVKTIQVNADASGAGTLTFDLDGSGATYSPLSVTGILATDTKEQIAQKVVDAINASGAINTVVVATRTTGATTNDTITLTYQTPALVSAAPTLVLGTATGATFGSAANATTGAPPVKASSSMTLGTFGTAVTLDADDKITFAFSDGATARSVEITKADLTGVSVAGKISSNADFLLAFNNAMTRQGLNTSYVATLVGSTFKIEAANATGGQNITVTAASAIGTVDTDTATAKAQGLAAPSGGATNGADVTKGFTSTTVAGTSLTLAAGDTITVNYMLDGNAGSKTLAITTGGAFAAADFLTAWNAATPATPGVVLTNTSGTLKFESQTTGSTGAFTLVDATVRSSTATGGVIKNLDVLTGLTSAKAASVKTAALTWSGLGATDKVTLNASADGQALTPVTVDAGATVDDFVANLNANAAFSAKLSASKTTSGELLLTSKTTGATSAASLTSISFAKADGSAKNVAGTGFGSVVGAATATTAAFTSPVTLDDDDNLYFKVQVDQATAARDVTISKATINKALSVGAAAPVTNGTIGNAADFKKVVDQALIDAGLNTTTKTAVTTAVNTSNQLVFTSSSVGTNSKLVVSDVSASQGGDTISVQTLDISAAGLAKVGATSADQIKQVLSAYIDAVNTAITKVTSAAASLGSVASRIDLQKGFVDTLMDTIDKGVGNLVDADMSEESTRLQALQVKQQLGVQALSIANQASQNILSLFRN